MNTADWLLVVGASKVKNVKPLDEATAGVVSSPTRQLVNQEKDWAPSVTPVALPSLNFNEVNIMQLKTKAVTALVFFAVIGLPLHAAQPGPSAGAIQDASRHATLQEKSLKRHVKSKRPSRVKAKSESDTSQYKRYGGQVRYEKRVPVRALPRRPTAEMRSTPEIPAQEIVPPEITSPHNETRVDNYFKVRGIGVPGAEVEVAMRYVVTTMNPDRPGTRTKYHDLDPVRVSVRGDGTWVIHRLSVMNIPDWDAVITNGAYITLTATQFFGNNKKATAREITVRPKRPD